VLPASSKAVGSTLRLLPLSVSLVLVAASKLSTSAPVAEPLRKLNVPTPRAIASEKPRLRLLASATPVELKEVSVGARVSAGAVLLLNN